MVELTIDGAAVEVPEGSMVMHAANKLGVYVPHFCYHKKLSIAANCRMCLVEVEKAPKALPACATPVTNGMIVHTQSPKAVAAQKSVMEFLLINHPLDCPICDQGGECQLQDLAVGYGGSASRYREEKRVVFHKSLGPLVSAEEMARCIHCTRCVRFGQEIAGVMELGMLNRGEHSEITSFVGRAVESELSGNMIDVCPVGALTSKPFRYSARTWELARRRSVSPHDSLNANIIVQVKMDEVLRVVPFENDDVNECWISDRDRFSYEGLGVEDRLKVPMVRMDDGSWREASWADALRLVAEGLTQVKDSFGAGQIGALAAPYATTEEFSLLARVVRGLGSDNVDFRLRQTDAGLDAVLSGTPWLGMPVADIGTLDRVLVIGSFPRADQPLITQRLRQAAKHGTQVTSIDVAADDLLMPLAGRLTVTPDQLANAVAEVAVAFAQSRGTEVPAALTSVQPSDAARRIADSLAGATNAAIWLGSVAIESPQAARIVANAQALAQAAGARLGFLVVGGNAVGGHLARAIPERGGKNAAAMLAEPLKSYIVLHAEPTLDTANGAQALASLKAAQFNVALVSYASAAADWANVMLPVAPFTETSGTFVNLAGTVQSFKGTVRPLGETRPAWKVLRVLGNLLQLQGFDEESSEAVRDAALGSVAERLSNTVTGELALTPAAAGEGLARITDVPIYFSDAITRRATSLQAAPASRAPRARLNPAEATRLGLGADDRVRVRSAAGSVELGVALDAAVPEGAVRIAGAHPGTVALGSAFGNVTVERV
ncbi:NADH-quinone oxidoreductase subunit G [Achromobacter sp. GG226]|uniref:NADH-quinone oxidoreductase subunit NuoG n=1 Tax=Verticiella alkaliphila TaxID=2779529 RepID=UPI001C0C9DA9|nr:NADH-quinone oxidoreductase subunit NuoG [Verticiella sp. GG226]MBU4611230.1 NADH-quinone oxidoreductase subunit G [Verticiella sp. GG226]